MKTGLFMIIVLMSMIFGCAHKQPVRSLTTTMSFDQAVEALAENLFQQVYNEGANLPFKDYKFVVDPFVIKETGEVVEASKDIIKIISKTAKKVSPKFDVSEINSNNHGAANYVILGKIQHETANKAGKQVKMYRIYASVIDKTNSTIAANASIWISDERIKYSAVGVYKDSPMFILDSNSDIFMKLSQSAKGSKVDSNYINNMNIKAVLAEVDNYIDMNDWKSAYNLLKTVDAGDSLKYYTALYLTTSHLGKTLESESAFKKMVDIGIDRKNMSMKFLFAVNSTNFLNNKSLQSQYDLWLRIVAQGVAQHNICMNILGHTSRTGSEHYNETLSRNRSVAVQKIMQKENSSINQRTKAIGRGFKDNISGVGTDDALDAIDRRVEFAIVNCANL